MAVFKNQVHEDIWTDAWCHTCFEPHEAARRIQGSDTQCPIRARYLRTKAKGKPRKPGEWERTRKTTMVESIHCDEYMPRPASTRVNRKDGKDFEDVPMFDVGELDTRHEVDHA